MRTLLAAAFAFLACVLVSSAEELQPFPQSLTDPQFLASQSWKPSREIDNVVTNWSPYTGKQGFSDKMVLKNAKTEILGGTFDAEYRIFKDDPSVEIVFWSGASDYKSDCSSFLTWTTHHFGKPAKAMDMSKPGKENSWIEWTADWLFGQARVQATCGGAKMGDTFIPALVSIVYRHHSMLKAIQDLVYVECSVTRKYIGSLGRGNTAPEQSAPLTFIIDPNRERLLRADKSAFYKTERYSDEEILATDANKDISMTIRLNRITGGFSMETRLKNDPRSGADHWGKCERESGEKKF